MAAKRKNLAELLAETQALKAKRNVAKARISRAQREVLAPQPPSAAIAAYARTMDTYAKRVEALVEWLVVGRLPVLGSGDLLDRQALEAGLVELEGRLDVLAERARRSARAAAKRASQHARQEVGRILKLQVPDDARSKDPINQFVDRNVALLQRAGRAQVAKIREAIGAHREGASLAADIRHALWVSRNRGQLIARDQVWKLQRATIQQWALAAGSEWFVYCTARDERVRRTHAAHDGKRYRWSERPGTLDEPNCRCRMLPVEAALL